MKGAILWKRILNEGIDTLPHDYAGKELSSLVLTSPIIVDERPTGREIAFAKFAGIALPFTNFWIEGVYEMQDAGRFVAEARWGGLVFGKPEDDGSVNVGIIGILGEPGIRPFVAVAVNVIVDPSGNPSTLYDIRQFPGMDYDKTQYLAKFFRFLILDTLSLLGCKNVSLKPNNNDPKEVRRAMKRHGGSPDRYRYHTLVVRPPGARSDAPAQDIGIMPRHVCRGHFAEYGPEFGKGLLFGKYAGRFYIPPHLKGDNKNGVVEKDYMVPAGAG